MFFRTKSKKSTKMFDTAPDNSDTETLNSSTSSISNNSSENETGRCSNVSQSSDAALSSLDFRCKDFKLMRKIGSGDIGKVYLCKVRSDEDSRNNNMYAMKVVDKQVLKMKKKVERAETEKKILRVLDHPFLPKMFAEFDAGENYSCVVMEYCCGGDLHSLRFKQPGRRFSLNAARFYAAEVLLALEYLHMLGIVYRDLKPENILIRSDGHIMLSDFDLSLQSTSSPTLQKMDLADSTKKPRHSFALFRSKPKTDPVRTRFVAEPVSARSNSFVGTHEYVSPEVASGQEHTNAVDWWAYGIFLYEIIYGETPFVGPSNKATLQNIVNKQLSYPVKCVTGELSARNLISGLLCKDPKNRMGSKFGAADIKSHPFFSGLNFALMRSVKPPYVPGLKRAGSCNGVLRLKAERFDYF